MNILVAVPFTQAQRERLEAAAPDAKFTFATRRDVTAEQVAAADVVVGNVAPALLTGATRVQLLQLNSAGYDDYLVAGALPAGTVLACASGAYGQAVSEHMFAMLLALMKKLPAYRDDQRAHAWRDHGAVTSLCGARVLVLGTGDIGMHFARLAGAFGTRVIGVRRHAGTCPAGFDAVAAVDELPQLLPQADVVASFLPSTPNTRGLAGAAFFGAMKPTAYFLNGGRGDLVDQTALADALTAGRLAGAALDVTSPEPLPANDPLWNTPNVLITPHISGGFHLLVVLDNIADIAAENLRRLQAGEPIRNEVHR